MTATMKDELIKITKAKTKLDERKFLKYMDEVQEKTDFKKWAEGRKIEIQSSRTYQDIVIYDLFSIRFFSETKEFLGFVSRFEALYDLFKNTKEFTNMILDLQKLIDVLTNDLDIKWNGNEKAALNQIKWISDFVMKLGETSDNLLFHFKRKELFINDCGVSIKFGYATEENLVVIEQNNNSIKIDVNKYYDSSLKELEKQLEEKGIIDKIRSKRLSNLFKIEELNQRLLDELVNDRFGYKYSDVKERLIKYIEKAVPGPIFDVLYTTHSRDEVLNTPYVSFRMEYYKCDFGYYFIDMAEKEVIFKETREELLAHCLGKIALTSLKTVYK